jgi:Uma2 family endonuclease
LDKFAPFFRKVRFMTPATVAASQRPIIYPETDGLPMAENTRQYNAIVTIKENLEFLFASDPLVFIAADLFWYPREGDNKLRTAPDVLVSFGVPKGDRGSYRTWDEQGIPPQVVFEVLSPGNRIAEMTRKFAFYDEHGVEEYYIFDPEEGLWVGWLRREGRLRDIESMHGWISPRLGIRFESVPETELTLFLPDGERFLAPLEMNRKRREAEERAELNRLAQAQAGQRANRAEQRADAAERAAKEQQLQIERLSAQLRAAGVEPS